MINFLFHSIKGKLLFAFFFLLGIALLFQFAYIAPTLQKRKIEGITKSQDNFAKYLASDINSRIEEAIKELEEIASLQQIVSIYKTSMNETITAINNSNHFFNYYFVMDKQGKWLSYPTHPELIGKTIPAENMGWVNKTFKSEKTVFLDVVKSKLGTLVSGFSTQIRNKENKTIALLRSVFVISENNVLVRLIENTQTIKGYHAYLVSSDGWLIAQSNQKLNYKEFNSYSMMGYKPVINALKGQSGITSYAYEDKLWLAAFYPINITNWGLIVQQPLKNIILEAKAEARFITFIILSCFCISLFIAAIVVQKAISPLFKLVKHIQSGKIDMASDQASSFPKDEIGQLAFQYSRLYSDLYRTNDLIRRSENKFRTLFNNASDAIYIHDLEGNLLEANQKAFDYSGYERDELLNMKVTDIDAPESAAVVQSRIEKVNHDEKLIFESLHRTKTGDLIPVEISSRTIEYDDQKAILSVVRDLTERKKAEDALKESHKRFLTVLDGIDATICVLDIDTYQILFMNKYMIESFGNDMTGKLCWDIFRGESGPCRHCTNEQLIDAKGEPTGVIVWQDKNPITGKWYVNYDRAIEWTDGRLVKLQIATDITDFKIMEAQLHQAQKMEAIGTLSGGIAHDFNNILSGIFGFSQLAKTHIDHPEKAKKDIDQIITGAQRATELVQQILAFSRQSESLKYPLEASVVIKETLKLLRSTIPSTIAIKENIVSKAKILAVPTQIHQIVMNLCTNAYHAMSETGGFLFISLKEIVFSKKDCVPELNIVPGKYLDLEISDTGHGIDSMILQKIFDPYFTTKEPGKGTGLGLAVIFGIVKESKGHITVHSEPGQGSTFHVYLPIVDGPLAIHIPENEGKTPLSGQETIMFVDDEEALREVTHDILKGFGYTVHTLSSGPKAFETYNEDPCRFDLVVTDMTMPGMTGLELSQRILELRPEQPIVLCTGYSETIDREKALSIGITEYVEKPMIIKELAKVIRKVLDEAKGSAQR
ncbi:two component protein (response regulator/sensory box histidine kinase) [Desulforapulum autotrophicum HRM2]|uniref:histidine kinase n=1 Tax=Desulforapulum autotrophicum (strain ATCC 43914 / DSM 3382 / VKM B-1955 / HRM2) TaxID=177437 RepID=C0Q9P9_DESAH|nr:PAS domain S-box protein [Desulforapulum autotrophicum]ACN14613.1 two component protein (response regulator/sensory box histidine kinase) [Desulforapulum autotrophicum HRM2]